MAHIVAGIVTLIQYLDVLKNEPKMLRPERCPFCGKLHPWIHGGYPRKAGRSCRGDKSLNPIYILRYYCSGCGRTCSVLPECISPRRRYLWRTQEAAILLLLAGKSIYAAAKEIAPSRHTISRWLARFKKQLHLHKDVLCNLFSDLGRLSAFTDFWQACLQHIALAQAMRLCHASGVPVP